MLVKGSQNPFKTAVQVKGRNYPFLALYNREKAKIPHSSCEGSVKNLQTLSALMDYLNLWNFSSDGLKKFVESQGTFSIQTMCIYFAWGNILICIPLCPSLPVPWQAHVDRKLSIT